MESDEFIKSSVENLVSNPSESEGENGCDMPAYFTTFSNILFDVDYESDSIDDQSLSNEDFLEEIYSKPLFEEEINSMRIDQHHLMLNIHLVERLLYDNSSPRPPEEFISENSNSEIESFSPSPIPNEDSDSFMEEIDLSFNPNDPMPPSIEDDEDDSERYILILEELPNGNTGSLNIKMIGEISDQKVPIPNLMITLVSNQEKSPDLLSYQGLEIFQPFAEYPMMINGKNTPLLDFPLFHFYPLDQTKYRGV
nr:hypothetical protein [Tanacetum cinerariifolium]